MNLRCCGLSSNSPSWQMALESMVGKDHLWRLVIAAILGGYTLIMNWERGSFSLR